jgi:hypothetical protein
VDGTDSGSCAAVLTFPEQCGCFDCNVEFYSSFLSLREKFDIIVLGLQI